MLDFLSHVIGRLLRPVQDTLRSVSDHAGIVFHGRQGARCLRNQRFHLIQRDIYLMSKLPKNDDRDRQQADGNDPKYQNEEQNDVQRNDGTHLF